MAASAHILDMTALFFGLTTVFAMALYRLLQLRFGIPNASLAAILGGRSDTSKKKHRGKRH